MGRSDRSRSRQPCSASFGPHWSGLRSSPNPFPKSLGDEDLDLRVGPGLLVRPRVARVDLPPCPCPLDRLILFPPTQPIGQSMVDDPRGDRIGSKVTVAIGEAGNVRTRTLPSPLTRPRTSPKARPESRLAACQARLSPSGHLPFHLFLFSWSSSSNRRIASVSVLARSPGFPDRVDSSPSSSASKNESAFAHRSTNS